MPSLRQGYSGPEVTSLQQKLNELGFSPGVIDGVYGTGTKAAVLAFQRCAGLLGDGIAGPRTLAALGLAEDDSLPSAIPGVTVAIVARMFPATPRRNISTHLPHVLVGLKEQELVDKPMVLMALATIRAESEGFVPIDEGISQYNTSPIGHPFDLYDHRADLGNQGPPDGEVFRGRGFIQLTGRDNYGKHGAAIGLGTQLTDNPELANDPDIAAKLLASFLKRKEREIKEALLDRNYKQARRLVNGGSHGLTRFTEAFRIGDGLIA